MVESVSSKNANMTLIGKCSKIFKYSINSHSVLKTCAPFCVLIRKLSYVPAYYTKDKDPAPLFLNPEVTSLLWSLTRIDIKKVYKKRKLEEDTLRTPRYEFMTDEEVQKVMTEAINNIRKHIQMPPILKVRDPVNYVLAKDPALQGLETAKLVFTDITYGINDSERLILIRQPDGTLEKADWDTRHRMNQLYFPKNGRDYTTPLMFEPEYLEPLLDKYEYEFILDRACVQFEPNAEEYQTVTSITYQHLNDNFKFEILRSTRHFGPLAFYLAWFKTIDNLLLDVISSNHLNEAADLIHLHNKLHGKETPQERSESAMERLVEGYIAKESAKRPQLELAMQAHKEFVSRQKDFEEGIKKAHGLS